VQPGDAIRVVTGVDPVSGINTCSSDEQTIEGTITGGSVFANGAQFRQICDPIGPVGSDNFDSFDLFAFEEQQAVELTAPLELDTQRSLRLARSSQVSMSSLIRAPPTRWKQP
jgi:hypothetical protein